jgi:hypothetical protein
VITRIGELSYQFTTDDADVIVTFAPMGDIMLFGSRENVHQMYDNKEKYGLRDLKAAFSNTSIIRRRCKLHHEGILNKEKFKNSIRKIYEKGDLNEGQLQDLETFIDNCRCLSGMVPIKLAFMGYKDLVDHPDFECGDDLPELTRTIQIMQAFVEEADGFRES